MSSFQVRSAHVVPTNTVFRVVEIRVDIGDDHVVRVEHRLLRVSGCELTTLVVVEEESRVIARPERTVSDPIGVVRPPITV